MGTLRQGHLGGTPVLSVSFLWLLVHSPRTWCYFKKYLFVCLFLMFLFICVCERVHKQGKDRDRERHTESKAGSRL